MKAVDRMLVARRVPNGRLGIIEKVKTTSKSPRLNEDEQRAQATLMMTRRLFGDGTVARLSEEFGVAPATVNRRLDIARRDGIPDEVRRCFIEEMLPTSMVVLQDALRGDDLKLAVQVALKIVDGLKALDTPRDDVAATVEETFEVWRAKHTVSRPLAAPASASTNVIDTSAVETDATGDAAPGSPERPLPVRLPTYRPDDGAGPQPPRQTIDGTHGGR